MLGTHICSLCSVNLIATANYIFEMGFSVEIEA
jgi:hypothetical protein